MTANSASTKHLAPCQHLSSGNFKPPRLCRLDISVPGSTSRRLCKTPKSKEASRNKRKHAQQQDYNRRPRLLEHSHPASHL
jgi:hypothetical protein